jgi:predicted tellurium resistance membrane protein TerC
VATLPAARNLGFEIKDIADMENLLNLFVAALGITLVDIDNAMYTTSRIGTLESRRRLALFLSLLLEFIGRLGLLVLFAMLTNEQEPLFRLFGIEFSIETIALFVAGGYLLISSALELTTMLRKDDGKTKVIIQAPRSLGMLLLQMSLILTLMSVDTILVIMSQVTALGIALFLLLFSAAFRLFFVQRLVHFIELYPAVQIFVTVLLMAIGIELIVQGLGMDFEAAFNMLLILVVVIFIGIQRNKMNNQQPENNRQESTT